MGSTTNQASGRSFQATAVAISAYSLVTLDSAGKIAASGDNATEQIIGVTTEDVAASANGNVQLLNAGGTIQVLAGGNTIAVADTCYIDGSGKVGTDTSNTKIGVALLASSTDGDVIELIPHQTFLA
tara:strand:+ start:160 stop:540 length:381 start_codon:yes stop_codon:yes gene_type:complete